MEPRFWLPARLILLAAVLSCTADETPSVRPPDPPTIEVNDQTVEVVEDGEVAITLDAVASEEVELSYSVESFPQLGALFLGESVIFRPWQDVNGRDTFTWRASLGDVESSLATVELVIIPTNDAPTGDAATVSTPQGLTLEVSLSAVDPDDDLLVYSLVTPAGHGNALVTDGGRATYTPDADYVGDDRFEWSATDPAGAHTGPVTVRIDVH